ncbi:hypothetical protein ACH5RR_026574 [Cinchona calisaya]|uniref:F-box/kelch-repeat protein n=1 Tax=Cinchona calisaya TaxID=153742 RepID=A0ABD2Z6X4_9GENT
MIALLPSHRSHAHSQLSPYTALHLFDPLSDQWLRFPLNFLSFPSLIPITSSHGLLYLWASFPIFPNVGLNNNKTLIICNPLTRQFKAFPQLGSACSRHGFVLIGASLGQVLILTELATLYSTSNSWLKFSSNLLSKQRSSILIENFILARCDMGSSWRSHACLTILILRLDLESWEWDELGRMPPKMYRVFQDSSKFKVFGGGIRFVFLLKGLEDWCFGSILRSMGVKRLSGGGLMVSRETEIGFAGVC